MNLFAIFSIWRITLFVLAWIGSFFLLYEPRFPYSDIFFYPSGLPFWVWSFANFDGVHYLTIAERGYAAQYTQVFFPLYPLILRVFLMLLPFISPIVLGIGISSLLFFFSIQVFSKLVRIDYGSDQAWWSALFLLSFPTAFYFGSIYTESLFFLLVISCFYFARKKQYALAALCGALASGTRIVGIMLFPALLIEIWQQHQENLKFKISNVKFMIFMPMGLLSYMWYLWKYFGDPLYFWRVQPVFGAERSGDHIILLPQVLWRYTKMLSAIPLFSEVGFITSIELISFLLCLFLLYQAYRFRMRYSYLFFSLVCVIIPTLTGTLSSMPRYVLIVFPMYMVCALSLSLKQKISIVSLFVMLQGVLVILFTRGHWVS